MNHGSRPQILTEQNHEVNFSAAEPAERVYASLRCVTIPLEFEDATQGTGREVP